MRKMGRKLRIEQKYNKKDEKILQDKGQEEIRRNARGSKKCRNKEND